LHRQKSLEQHAETRQQPKDAAIGDREMRRRRLVLPRSAAGELGTVCSPLEMQDVRQKDCRNDRQNCATHSMLESTVKSSADREARRVARQHGKKRAGA
jgi:hypothetical protein